MENVQAIRDLSQHDTCGTRVEIARRQGTLTRSAALAHRNRVLEEQLTFLRRGRDELQHVMYEAAQMQRKLCGPRFLCRDSFEIASEIFPVRHLSGDFVTVLERETDLAFVIGDIGGKGLSAGMWFTQLISMIRLQIETACDPAGALFAINRDLLRTGLELPLTTMLLGWLNLQTGETTYCSAGHPPALVIRKSGNVESLTEGGPVLGALVGACFTNGKTTLQPGDTLLAFSDGVAECRNENGLEFGPERVASAAQVSRNSGASSTLFSILGAAEDFAGRQSREDDMALIVIRRVDL